MRKALRRLRTTVLAAISAGLAAAVAPADTLAGDTLAAETRAADNPPQPVDTTGLRPLGDAWLSANPYRGNARAAEIGGLGYNRNCARCHGLDAVSGGVAPDLRDLPADGDGDTVFIDITRKGKSRNGIQKMPNFEGFISQEAMWAIRTWLMVQPGGLPPGKH